MKRRNIVFVTYEMMEELLGLDDRTQIINVFVSDTAQKK